MGCLDDFCKQVIADKREPTQPQPPGWNCLERRIAEQGEVESASKPGALQRNLQQNGTDWRFTT